MDEEHMYLLQRKKHVTYNFHIGYLDQRAEHMSQMQAVEFRSMLYYDLLKGFKLYY